MFKDTKEVKDRIVMILRRRGPSLPVHVAKDSNLTMLFASAFLSELIADKMIKMSYMRIGSSPIYFVPEHESLLERFSASLKSKEKEAYILLKEKRFLKDQEQDPAIRVALRAIKDFAKSFERNNELIWRYFTVPESEFQGEIKPVTEIKQEIVREIKEEPVDEVTIEEVKEKVLEEKPKPLVKVREKSSKSKEKSDFCIKIIKLLERKDIELLSESNSGKKDFEGNGRINSDLGKIELLIIGKDRKKITEDDLIIAIQKGSLARKMILFITTGTIDKKAEDFFNYHQGIIKFIKM